MNDLHTIDLTLRIICEPADATRIALSGASLGAVCQAAADALALDGRFYVAPRSITWVSRGETGEEADDSAEI